MKRDEDSGLIEVAATLTIIVGMLAVCALVLALAVRAWQVVLL